MCGGMVERPSRFYLLHEKDDGGLVICLERPISKGWEQLLNSADKTDSGT